MAETRIPVQDIHFEGHRARVEAIYDSDANGRFRFVKFELMERKRRGRKPGKRRGRKPGPKPGRKRRKSVAESKAAV
jgi:hypothetical protein